MQLKIQWASHIPFLKMIQPNSMPKTNYGKWKTKVIVAINKIVPAISIWLVIVEAHQLFPVNLDSSLQVNAKQITAGWNHPNRILIEFFSAAANSYELNNLNNDTLDAPIYNNPIASSQQMEGDNNQNFNSLPCETFLVACKTESDLSSGNRNFNHNNPLYQSAQVQSKNNSDNFVLPKASECYIDILLVTIKCLNWNFISEFILFFVYSKK